MVQGKPWYENALPPEVIEFNSIRLQSAWRVRQAQQQLRDELNLKRFRTRSTIVLAHRGSGSSVFSIAAAAAGGKPSAGARKTGDAASIDRGRRGRRDDGREQGAR